MIQSGLFLLVCLLVLFIISHIELVCKSLKSQSFVASNYIFIRLTGGRNSHFALRYAFELLIYKIIAWILVLTFLDDIV